MNRETVLAEVIRRLKRARQLEHHDKPALRDSPFIHEDPEGIGHHTDWETRFEIDPEVDEIESRIYKL